MLGREWRDGHLGEIPKEEAEAGSREMRWSQRDQTETFSGSQPVGRGIVGIAYQILIL